MDRVETEFFTNNKLVKLTIRDSLYPHRPHENVIFPVLKTLSLISLGFSSEDMYGQLISGCPVLENLSLHYSEDSHPPNWSGVVSSPSIKRLTIFHNFPSYREAHDDVTLETPNLVFLDYSGYIADHYEVYLTSLVEARLDLRSWEQLIDEDENDADGDVTDLVAGISKIKTLHLSPDSLEVFHFCCKSMPVFNNLLKLSFESHREKGWQVLPLLLNNSPNLKTLVIEGLVHQVTDRCGDACVCIHKKEQVCCLSTCQVKVLTISRYRGTRRELKQMRHFLGNMKCLETVNVGVKGNDHQEDNNAINNRHLRITNALIKLPRVSSHCRIHFF